MENPIVNEDQNNNMNVEMDGCIKAVAIETLIKAYIKHLFCKGLIDSKQAAKDKVGEIASPALDRGMVTQANIDCICNWIDAKGIELDSMKFEKMHKKFLCKAVEGMAIHGCNDPDLAKLMELKKQKEDLCQVLRERYGAVITGHAKAFMSEFANLFDPGFVAETSNISKFID